MPAGYSRQLPGWCARISAAVAVAVLAIMGLSGPLHAQSNSGAAAVSEQPRAAAAGASNAQAGTDSQLLAAVQGPDVGLDQVLAHPDDSKINGDHAKTLIRQGNLAAASTTLERILLTHPEMQDVRLLYAMVLFRLDDMTSANAQLDQINPGTLSSALRAEHGALRLQIAQQLKTTQQRVTLAVGAHYDSDRNAAPRSGQILIGNLPFTLAPNLRKKADAGADLQLGYDFDYDLGQDPQLVAYGRAGLLGDDQAQLHTLNTNAGSLELGLRRVAGPDQIEVGVYNGLTGIDNHLYLHQYGLAVRPTHKLDERWDLLGEAKLETQLYNNITLDPTAGQSSGYLGGISGGAAFRPNPAHRLVGEVAAERRASRVTFQSYDRTALRLSDTWLLGGGQFLTGGGELARARYDGPLAVFSAKTRTDNQLRLGLTHGIPVGTLTNSFGGTAPKEVADLVLTSSLEYFVQSSNITNYSYDDLRASFLVSKQWVF